MSLPTVKVPGVIRPVGALRAGTDGIGVGVGALLVDALLHGKALEVVPPVVVPPPPQAASSRESTSSISARITLIGARRPRALRENKTMKKPPKINGHVLEVSFQL